MNIPSDLQPGDWLGYRHHDILAEAIYLNTGGSCTHSAVYHGNGMVITSLAGGVNLYQMDMTGLVKVRRPIVQFDIKAADANFEANLKGKPYGYQDCLRDKFPDWPVGSSGMNCSHATTAYYDGGNLFLFAPDFPRNVITPRDIETSVALDTVWRS